MSLTFCTGRCPELPDTVWQAWCCRRRAGRPAARWRRRRGTAGWPPVHAGCQRVHALLGGGPGGVIGQGAPPALRRRVVGLLHHALAVAMPRRADIDREAVILRQARELGGERAAARMADGGHPGRPPPPGQPAQPPHHLIQGLGKVREVLGLGQHPAPAARRRQGPDQQMRMRPARPPPASAVIDVSRWLPLSLSAHHRSLGRWIVRSSCRLISAGLDCCPVSDA